MKIWKPLTKFLKPRDEVGYHTDLALEPGERFYISFGDPYRGGVEASDVCPEGKVWKIHFELAVEEFEQ